MTEAKKNIVVELDGETVLTFNFKASERTEKRKLSELPLKTVYTLLQYGTRKANDSVNSAVNDKNNDKTRDELIDAFMAKIDSGEFENARDTTETDFKKYVLSVCKAHGASAKSLKGITLEKALEAIAKSLKADTAKVETALRKQFEAQQAAIKSALEALK